MRNNHECFQTGELLYLQALDYKNNNAIHPFVFAFARQTKEETGIVVINFNHEISHFRLDLSKILNKYEINSRSVCFVQNLQTDDKGEYYFVSEIINENFNKSLKPFKSIIFRFDIKPNTDSMTFKKTLGLSVSRLIYSKNKAFDSFYLSLKLKDILEEASINYTSSNSSIINYSNLNFEKFVFWFLYTMQTFKKYNFKLKTYFSSLNYLKDHLNTQHIPGNNVSSSLKLANSFYFGLKLIMTYLNSSSFEAEKAENNEANSNQIKKFNKPEKKNSINSVHSVQSNNSTNTFNLLLNPEIKSNLQDSINKLLESNSLGPVVFVTPELGRWSTVGGLGVMVDELSQGLVAQGREVIIISPYYNKNRKGESDYLQTDPAKFEFKKNITIELDDKYEFGVHYGEVNNVKLYFIHNYLIFPSPYPDGTPDFTTKQIACFSKSSLELLCAFKIIPEVLLTNDWFTGMVAAYSKHGHFGSTFSNTTFFHICHNLQESYEGRIYPEDVNSTYENIYKLPAYLLIDPYWNKKVINPSRCALMCSDQWGTVSQSYKAELLATSDLKVLLKNYPTPFAFPNGIFRSKRLEALEAKVKMSHLEAKAVVQKKYFGIEEFDNAIPLFSFVGRITEQKGVKLICEIAEMIINKMKGKINILVGGMGNMKDPYCILCVKYINNIRQNHKKSFWADPTEFFTDGPLINKGSDFGLMPSLFEPGGIVQHEMFIASTPVLAFKTGGLKDTVHEYDYNTTNGNGINFVTHNSMDFMFAFERAVKLFNNAEHYAICRKNAFNAAIDVLDVAKAWDKEFYRIRSKVYWDNSSKELEVNKEYFSFNNRNMIDSLNCKLNKFDSTLYTFKDEIYLDKLKKNKSYRLENTENAENNADKNKLIINFLYVQENMDLVTSVKISGSFNEWKEQISMTFDPIFDKWSVWGLGIGDWGLGIGPNPQSPIPNPQSPIILLFKCIIIINIKIILYIIYIYLFKYIIKLSYKTYLYNFKLNPI